MTWQRIRRRVAVVAMLAGVAVPPAAWGQEPPTEELDEAQRGYDEALAEEEAILAEYVAATARVDELAGQAAELDGRVSRAEREVASAEVDLDTALAAVADAQARADAAARALAAAGDVLRDQAVAAYVAGLEPMAVAGTLLRSGGLSELEKGRTYADVVIGAQREAIDAHRVAELRAEEEGAAREAARARAEAIRDDLGGRAAELETARTRLASVQAEADAEAGRQQSLLAEVQARRGLYEQRVAELQAQSELIEALLREQAAARAEAPEAGGDTAAPSGNPDAALADPLSKMVVTSAFGYRIHPIYGTGRLHAGIDLDGDTGDPVFAAGAGVVVSAGAQGGYGNCVVIDHGDGTATLYAHLSSITVRQGASVESGERVGAVGSTGASTGSHLHFEVRVDGTPVNPAPYLS